MAFSFFGYTLGKEEKGKKIENPSVIPPAPDGSIINLDVLGRVSQIIMSQIDALPKEEIDLILLYRQIAAMPEVTKAIDEIVNDFVSYDSLSNEIVRVDLSDIDISEKIKRLIEEEFQKILELLSFDKEGAEIFRNFYIDGRLYYHKNLFKNEKKGIARLEYIDSTHIGKYKFLRKNQQTEEIESIDEFYIYNPYGTLTNRDKINSSAGVPKHLIKFPVSSIVQVTSGLYDPRKSMILSYIHDAVSPARQLSTLERAAIIYRAVRAPEKKVFNVEIGEMGKTKADSYMEEMMSRHRNKVTYDATTGEISADKYYMSMVEDYWFPKRQGQGTTVDVLQGGQLANDLEDINYFKRKLYESLRVPVSRLDSASVFNFGQSGEITREEVKFSSFIARLRRRFSRMLFLSPLGDQLILKNILSKEDWLRIKKKIKFVFMKNSHFDEINSMYLMKERLAVLQEIEPLKNIYFSEDWIRRNVLKQDEREIEKLKMERDKQQSVVNSDEKSNDGENDGGRNETE